MKASIFYRHLWTLIFLGIVFQFFSVEAIRSPTSSTLLNYLKFRGSSALTEETPENKDVDVIISTSLGSSFLDKKKKLKMKQSQTIKEVKESLKDKFPGSPPIVLQRLFQMNTLLPDELPLANLTQNNQGNSVLLILDMITGTSSYNRTLSVEQTVAAYLSSVVHLTYISDKLRQISNSPSLQSYNNNLNNKNNNYNEENFELESINYRQFYEELNSTFYQQYLQDIEYALEAERDPEMGSSDTAAWRAVSEKQLNLNKNKKNPLLTAFTKEFDLNFRTFKNYCYYTLILVVSYVIIIYCYYYYN
jgi:hypothetical protein